VNSMGYFMATTTSGTTGAGFVDGIQGYLDFWFDYQNGVHYTALDLGAADYGASKTQFGFTPEQVFEQFQAGGGVTVGLHNKPIEPGELFDPLPDPPFGHVVVLANVVLNANGTAWVTFMDPHLQPPATQGVFRTFLLHPNGLIDWTAANPGYYDPPSGKVALDAMFVLRDFALSATVSSAQTAEATDPARGEVPGQLTPGGHTWVGKFEPPAGSPGPWLLVVEATDAAGFTQKDYQYVTRR
jgi:hypothetical protein